MRSIAALEASTRSRAAGSRVTGRLRRATSSSASSESGCPRETGVSVTGGPMLGVGSLAGEHSAVVSGHSSTPYPRAAFCYPPRPVALDDHRRQIDDID